MLMAEIKTDANQRVVRPCCGGSVVVPKIKKRDENGVIKTFSLTPTGAMVDDYSIRNLDKAGIQLKESDPSSFRVANMDTSDSLINVAKEQQVINSQKSE